MIPLPRLALATTVAGTEPSPAALAWLAGLTDRRWRVQHFRSRACPVGTEAVGQLSGLPGRHLDEWIMPEPVLNRLFARGMRHADLALIEGTLDDAEVPNRPGPHGCEAPGRLSSIARILDLPTVAVLHCPGRGDGHLPRIPPGADAVFLDGLERAGDFERYRRMIRLTTRTPVVGGLDAMPPVREALLALDLDEPIPDEIVARLAESFLRYADLPAIESIAGSRPFRELAAPPSVPVCEATVFRVAYAQDEVFGGYFPDTLEALEGLGAELVEFSPLRDEGLPDRVDLVILGCGFPDHYAEALASNDCMSAALRQHVCRGRRIYSEGGGTAYLGRSMVLEGRCVRGVGILPFDAVLQPDPLPPIPVTRVLTADTWLAPRGTVVRGYQSNRWKLVPGADPLDCPSCFGPITAEDDMFSHHHAVGGLTHFHLGALAEMVAAFASPHPASLTLPHTRR